MLYVSAERNREEPKMDEITALLSQTDFGAARLAAAGQPLTATAMRDAPLVLADGQREGRRPRKDRGR